MSQTDAWAALSGFIKGLQSAGELYVRFQSDNRADGYGAGNFLRDQCIQAIGALNDFRQNFARSLPDTAVQRIDLFLKSRLAQASTATDTTERDARGTLIGLVAIETEITFILRGRQEQIRARSERAFLWLQRTLAVDDDVKKKWQKAFDKGEVECEKLGSLVLLSQGIYAFKINAEGARTDLVFAELRDESLLSRSVDGLVLTEWKVATAENAAQRFDVARKQADRYRQGPLAGSELTGYRYLIVVSEKQLPEHTVPADDVSDGVTYRCINIAVAPEVPSISAKRP